MTSTDVIPMDKLAKIYIKIRTARQIATATYEEHDKELKGQQDEVASAMKDQMVAIGSKSVKTEFGTVILGTKTRYFTGDWESFKQFVKDNDALDLMERRIAQRNMAEFIEKHPDKLPPGLSSETEQVVTVRKPS